MGQVIHCSGAARDPSIHNLFQIADVDPGVIRWVNADLVTHILQRAPRQQKTPHLARVLIKDWDLRFKALNRIAFITSFPLLKVSGSEVCPH